MNKAFDDLIYQSGLIADGCWDELGTYEQEAIERLIELTVRECIKLIEESTEDDEYWSRVTGAESIMAIEEHFGVEE